MTKLKSDDRVLIAMSGGVDSSVAALLLAKEGFSCVGATLKLHDAADLGPAKESAAVLGITLLSLDFRSQFKKHVQEHFVRSYTKGHTPNPCVECNKHIKFGCLLDYAAENGFSRLATGHYARAVHAPQTASGGRVLLKKALDKNKDQSYMLYSLTQSQLSRVIFPLGDLTKDEARAIAHEKSLPNADAPDSQDICFIPDGDYSRFIEEFMSDSIRQEGYILSESGAVLGKHTGLHNFTIGQRKGLGIALGSPAFVSKIDASRNAVYIGGKETLYSKTLIARKINLISIDSIENTLRVTIKTRYRQDEQKAVIRQISEDEIHAEFDEPQRALTPGQAAVFYDGDIVVGGGTIS